MHSFKKRKRPRVTDLLSAGAAILTVGLVAWLILGSPLQVGKPIVVRPTQNQISFVEDTIDMWAAEHGEFPTGGDEVLVELTKPGQMELPWLERLPEDGWGRPLHYRWPDHGWPTTAKPAIWSDGPNGINELGYDDDIRFVAAGD